MMTTSGAVRTAAVTALAALVLTACGSSDSSEAGKSPAPVETTSAAPEFTLADLVPDQDDIGAGFRAGDSVDAEISPVLRQGLGRCPAALGLIDSIDSPAHRQGYQDAEGRIIEVLIDDGAEPASEAALREVASALGNCDQRAFTLGAARVLITIAGGLATGVGEQALKFATTTTVATGGSSVSQNFYFLQFRRGDIGVQIRGLDAVQAGKRIKFDPAMMDQVSDAIDAAIEASAT